MTSPDQAYAGWQHERVNFMFGMNGRRTLLVALAVLCAVQPVAAARLSDALVAWPAAAVLIALAYTRVAGRTVDEWMVAAVSFQLLRLRGQNKFRSAAFAPAGPDPAAPGWARGVGWGRGSRPAVPATAACPGGRRGGGSRVLVTGAFSPPVRRTVDGRPCDGAGASPVASPLRPAAAIARLRTARRRPAAAARSSDGAGGAG
jgi:hypothetical protein